MATTTTADYSPAVLSETATELSYSLISLYAWTVCLLFTHFYTIHDSEITMPPPSD